MGSRVASHGYLDFLNLEYPGWEGDQCQESDSMLILERLQVVIATVGYAHRVHTLGEDGVGKHSPF